MKKCLFVFIIVICFAAHLFAQKDTLRLKNNSAYLELLGNGGLVTGIPLSANYEHIFKHGRYNDFSVRVGLSLPFYFSVPVLVNQICNPHGKSHLEMGIGGYVWTNSDIWRGFGVEDYGVAGCFMYRYQKPAGKFLFRFGWTPLFSLYDKHSVISFFDYFLPGLSAGYSF
ncbi:MAG TPA: hypothetical protein VL651_00205 [Bacteroidia bacterium]|jgi:hypothetical protein|nr:hypothetical protein [Bacteroidia bacterium]